MSDLVGSPEECFLALRLNGNDPKLFRVTKIQDIGEPWHKKNISLIL